MQSFTTQLLTFITSLRKFKEFGPLRLFCCMILVEYISPLNVDVILKCCLIFRNCGGHQQR